ncbi:hypothetical protein RFI_29047 [Reticulomyxa filosa]|uniref:Uncharacterized protein n=1 Tax=Reticulomyxa filosa TaxID=46433 RepID=X6M402_RETFI|nr:hypothetical protein RFI_29047 [Reticulomyxa filosa]|eukprot:ETO08341.1 hypothetical protein RFI_29047 [Reticulomyxa filosa]
MEILEVIVHIVVQMDLKVINISFGIFESIVFCVCELNLLKKFKDFVRLKQLYTVVSTNYMTVDDLSERLQEFTRQNYYNEQNTFQKLQELMKYLADMKDSCTLKGLWVHHRKEINEQTKLTFEMKSKSLSMEDLKWFEISDLHFGNGILIFKLDRQKREIIVKDRTPRQIPLVRNGQLIAPNSDKKATFKIITLC